MKKHGLIRWNFPAYLIVISLLAVGYIFFGLKTHVKSLLEQRLSALNGAQVTIGDLTLSPTGPRIELETLRFYDAQHADRVQLTLSQVKLDLEWQAFLRNRFVVTSGSVSGVQLHPLIFGKDQGTEAQAKGSVAAVADFLGNPVRGQVPEESVWSAVPSVQASSALQSEIDNQVSQWQKQLASLQKDVSSQSADLSQNKENETHTKMVEAQLARSLVELNSLETKVKADGNVLLGKIGTLAELVPHDMTVVRQAVKLPNLEFKTLGSELGQNLTKPLIGLAEMFKDRLIPWLLSREQELLPKFARLQGTDFHFEGRLLPPRLWIKTMEFTSKESPDGTLGDVIGRVQDLSSEPRHIPASISLQASFPGAEVLNVQLEAAIDHRNNARDDKLQLNVAEFPIRDLDFSRTPNLRLGVEQARANLNLEYVATESSSILNLKSTMTKVMFRNETAKESLKSVFDQALAPLTTIDIEASAQGNPKALLSGPGMSWTYASNLSEQVRGELQRILGEEFAEFNARVREKADQKGLAVRTALESKLVTGSERVQQEIAEARNRLAPAP